MDLQQRKDKFIEIWGALGSQWGINRTMAQIHALLLSSTEAKTTEDIMGELKISRGNANMNTRTLIDWGLVHKVIKSGERKEFFVAEDDMWEVTKRITMQRRKRELTPLIHKINALKEHKTKKGNKDEEHFRDLVNDISNIATKTEKVLTKVENMDQNWFTNTLLKFLKK
ncbi:MAG: transcriptional regulator [Flavobacteriales bacterium]|nr:transcriptional regulator [Flavobacteriales bacterium]